MPDDSIIVRVGADLSAVTAIDAAADSVASAMAKVKAATAAASLANVQLRETVKAVSEYQLGEAAAASTLAPALQRQAQASQALIAAKANLISARQADAAAAAEEAVASSEVTVAAEEEAAAQNEVSAATRNGISGRMAASASMRVLEGNMMGSTRAAGAFLATTLGLGPVLQAAFPIIGAIALLEVFYQLGKAIGTATDYLTGWTAEVKKAGAEQITRNLQMIEKNLQLRDVETETHTAGLQGAARVAAEEKSVDSERKNTLATLGLLRNSLKGLQQSNDDLGFHMRS